jgi:hypothetical protein
VTPDDFSSLIHSLPVGESLFLMFAWFAPYIELFTPGDLDTLLHLARSSPDLTEEAAEFVARFDEMRDHQWRLHKEYFQAGYFHISLAAFLRKDDILELKRAVLMPERVDTALTKLDLRVDVNQRIPPSIFERSDIVRHRPSLIQFAAFFAAVHCFRFLLALRDDIDLTTTDDAGTSLARFAVAGGNEQIVRHCVGLDLCGTAYTAVKYFRFGILQFLLARRLQTLGESTERFPAVIHAAARFDNLRVLLYCLEHDVDPNSRDARGWTPLHHAAACGQINALLTLLEVSGITVNAADARGRTPLHVAIRHNQFDAARILLSSPAVGVNVVDENGMSPLGLAIARSPSYFVQFLLSCQGVDVSARSVAELSLLHLAVKYGRVDVLEMLLRCQGIDVNVRDSVCLALRVNGRRCISPRSREIWSVCRC